MTPAEISWRDALVLVPLVAVIIALALYPQLPLDKGEASIPPKVEQAGQIAGIHREIQVIR